MTRFLFLAAAAAFVGLPAAAYAQTPPDYTADLNALPPSAARPTPPPPEPQRTSPPADTAAPSPQPTPAPTPQPVAEPPAPTSRPTPAQSPTSQSSPPPVASQSVSATPSAPASAPATPAAPRALTRAELDALPFSVSLPPGYAITAGRPGPDFQVWTVRKGGVAQLMIYAGPASQFPIHDGQMVEAGGRTTVVVMEEGRRRALEHLFRQSTAPNHVHVWVASVDGPDRDQAEAIGHGVSPR